jgi:hypothetical protein
MPSVSLCVSIFTMACQIKTSVKSWKNQRNEEEDPGLIENDKRNTSLNRLSSFIDGNKNDLTNNFTIDDH